jgi:hypothetical protein
MSIETTNKVKSEIEGLSSFKLRHLIISLLISFIVIVGIYFLGQVEPSLKTTTTTLNTTILSAMVTAILRDLYGVKIAKSFASKLLGILEKEDTTNTTNEKDN